MINRLSFCAVKKAIIVDDIKSERMLAKIAIEKVLKEGDTLEHLEGETISEGWQLLRSNDSCDIFVTDGNIGISRWDGANLGIKAQEKYGPDKVVLMSTEQCPLPHFSRSNRFVLKDPRETFIDRMGAMVAEVLYGETSTNS